jgi:hypothetical protein
MVQMNGKRTLLATLVVRAEHQAILEGACQNNRHANLPPGKLHSVLRGDYANCRPVRRTVASA